jgi:hypothetical protein
MRLKHVWEDSDATDPMKMICKNVDCIQLAENRPQWWTLVDSEFRLYDL